MLFISGSFSFIVIYLKVKYGCTEYTSALCIHIGFLSAAFSQKKFQCFLCCFLALTHQIHIKVQTHLSLLRSVLLLLLRFSIQLEIGV